MTADRDLFDEQTLIEAGLLPSPSSPSAFAMTNERCSSPRCTDPLRPELLELVERFADRLQSQDEAAIIQLDRNYELQARARRLETAVCWLRDAYDFDELTLRVFAHVLGEGVE